MKIGEFSKRYNVSTDTVRYYCKLGLLIPDDRGAQTQFAQRECQDMEHILRMKSQHFSLQEIRKYLDILRISTMVEPESLQEVVKMLDRKRYDLEQQAAALLSICADIDDEIGQLRDRLSPAGIRTGVPLSAISLLACPGCGQPLELENASLGHNYVYSGALKCQCGYNADIVDGIIHTGNLYQGGHDSPDLGRGLYRDVNDDFVVYMQRCTDFMLNRLGGMDLRRKVVLESHINGYFFLYNNLSALEPDCTYIIVDKYPEMLHMYKRNIEQLGLRRNILYIADATMNWPVMKGCVDVLISFMAGNEHGLYFKRSYIEDVAPFLGERVSVLGVSLGYEEHASSIDSIMKKYPEGNRESHIIKRQQEAYSKEGFIRDFNPVGVLKKMNPKYMFECHKEGEEMVMSYFAARRG